ncbi:MULTISPECIES: hypothetical protein [unclassified Cobetia]|uniref:hypothetical protein n=1 Tax=unclassified Cobetia TaxID=2609414 RepID=UPI0020979F34|nr:MULTISPECIES: hypothetical protein [unclassified Cobetia]MCO7234507.1 hypothetical protein [Cobetia sp. Dlab-2-U]
MWVWLAELATGQFIVSTWWTCQWQYLRNALPFEAGHCAFEGLAQLPDGIMALLAVMGLGWLLQAGELVSWWRQARRRLKDPEARVWLALGGSLCADAALASGGQAPVPEHEAEAKTEAESEAETEASDTPPVSDARHRHPEMQLCWWWADGASRSWQPVNVRCLWCSPRLIGLEISPQGVGPPGMGAQGLRPPGLSQPGLRQQGADQQPLKTQRVWLWPDSASSEDLHQLRLWLLWPPLPHGLPRQPPPLETLRRVAAQGAHPR